MKLLLFIDTKPQSRTVELNGDDTLSEIKVHKLSLGQYLFKRYTFVPIKFKYVHFKYEYVP